jgi:hypothetical protein
MSIRTIAMCLAAGVGAAAAPPGVSAGTPDGVSWQVDEILGSANNTGADASSLDSISIAGLVQPESAPESPHGSAPAGTEPPAAPAADHSTDLAKKLQNPVADLISVPFQFNYDEGFGPKDGARYTLNIQPVIPISISEKWNLISRTILPVIDQESIADGIDSDFGLGDVTQSLFFSPKKPVGGWILGFGPAALLPTGTSPRLRNEQLGLGPTVVALRQEHGWTYGLLANQIWAVTDSDDHDTINASFIQPFLSYTWPSATSLTLNSETTYDWTHHEATVPLNLMLSQLVKFGKQPVNFQIGGRYYVDSPDGGPEWGLRFAITFLFPK